MGRVDSHSNILSQALVPYNEMYESVTDSNDVKMS